jgi:hypothetical protein
MRKSITIKKLVLYGLTFLAAVWIASCQDPVSSYQAPAVFRPESGNVRITINSPDLNQGLLNSAQNADISKPRRNILPGAPDFAYYEVSFTPGSGQSQVEPITVQGADTEATISLPPGDWTVTVTGYVTINGDNKAAAEGSEELTVNANAENSVDITLSPLTEETGIFSYSVSFPSVVTTATLTLAAPDALDTAVRTYNLKEASSGNAALDAGYYVMALVLKTESNGTVVQQAGAADIIKINANMTTSADYTFADSDFVTPLVLSGNLAISAADPENLGDVTLSFHSAAPDYSNDANFNVSRMSYVAVTAGTPDEKLWNGTWTAALNPALFGENIYFSLVYGDKKGSPVNTPLIAKPSGNEQPGIALSYFPAPDAPVIAGGNEQVTVTWTAVTGADKYRVYYGTVNDPGDETTTTVTPDITEAPLSASITGLAKGTRYYVWVKAGAGEAWSAFSPVAEGWTIPDAPAAPTLSATTAQQITVSWTEVTGASSYEVYYSTANNHDDEAKWTSEPAGTTVNLTGFSDGTTYYVWIKAKNTGGTSAYSPVASRISTPARPAAPTVKTGTGKIEVTWSGVKGATEYVVYTQTSTSNTANPTATAGPKVSYDSSITDNGNPTFTVTLTERGDSHLSFQNAANLANGTTYYVRVRAVNASSPTITNAASFQIGGSDVSVAAIPIAAPTIAALAADGEIKITPTIGTGANTLWVYYDDSSSTELPDSPTWVSYTTPVAANTSIATGLTNFKSYYIYAKAGKADGTMESDVTGPVTVVPGAPTPTVSAGTGKIDVSWTALTGASSYEVWYGTTNNTGAGTTQKFGDDVSGTSATITGLTDNTLYYVWLKAKNGSSVTSGFGLPATARPIAAPAAPVIGVSSDQSLSVSWTAAAGATAYEVWYDTDSNPEGATQWTGTVSGTSTTVTGLTNFTNYYFWVKARNNDKGESDFSTVVEGVPGAPAAPTVEAGDSQLEVSWSAVSGATGYEVWYDTDSNPDEATKWTGTISNTSTTITGLTNDTIYYVWIKATNGTVTTPFGPGASNKTSTLIVINDATDFYKIGKETSHPADGRYKLNDSLTLGYVVCLPTFSGKLDGNGKTLTISGFDEENIGTNRGIFSAISGDVSLRAEVKDLTIDVNIQSSTVNITGLNLGMLAASVTNADLRNVKVQGTLNIENAVVGGTLGGISGSLSNSSITDSGSSLAITAKGFSRTGGIAGDITASSLSRCETTGPVTVTSMGTGNTSSTPGVLGGIAGIISGATTLEYCRVTGNISGEGAADMLHGDYIGGLVGNFTAGGIIRKSYSTSNVTNISAARAQNTCGGIAGTMRNAGSGIIEDCYSTGDITVQTTQTGSGRYAGGIVGFTYQITAQISRCYATGTVTSDSLSGTMAGGILGSQQSANSSVENCIALNDALYILHTTTNAAQYKINRVIGHYSLGSKANNKASSGMLTYDTLGEGETTSVTIPDADKTADGLGGQDCDAKPEQSVYSGLGWDFTSVWQKTGDYPTLKGF